MSSQDPEVMAMRWGYGLPLPAAAPTDPSRMMALLAGPDLAASASPQRPLADYIGPLNELRVKKKNSKKDPVLGAEVRGIEDWISDGIDAATRQTFARALDSADGFRERLVQFWADHFTTTSRNRFLMCLPLTQAEEAIRPNVTGRFADLLRAAVLHPAMISYLDQTSSVGPTSAFAGRRGGGLNENLARELLELHSLGVGSGYRQADVYQTAELLTGLVFDLKRGGLQFDPARAEPGAEFILGKRYEGDGSAPIQALLDDLASRPETARHIARKLVTHFVTDTPDPGHVGQIAEAFLATGGRLMDCYQALVDHPAAADPKPGKLRQPFDFMVAGMRALGVTGADLMALDRKSFRRQHLDAMALMGQPFKAPRGPDGAPEDGAAWITPQGMTARFNWAHGAAAWALQARALAPAPDFARLVLGSRADAGLTGLLVQAGTGPEALALVLTSPEFNRR